MKNFDKKIKDKLVNNDLNEVPSEASVSRMMSALDEKMPLDPKVRTLDLGNKEKRTLPFYFKIAASISLLFVIGYLTYSLNQVNVMVGNRAQNEVVLPDGSTVIINSDSELSYNKLMWYFDREVTFNGEAFFEVTKGNRFTVTSEIGTTQVLGTSFNVFARKRKYNVRCRTGKVKVSSKHTDVQVVLTPGKGVVMNKEEVAEYAFDTTTDDDWRSGSFYFEDEPYQNVISELERQYDVEVTYPTDYSLMLYTGYFDNRNLDKALKLISDPVGLEIRNEGKKIVLSVAK